MDDAEIEATINELVAEEHRLERAEQPHDAASLERIQSLEVTLDRCWDLLRQRRARRAAGLDPDAAAARPDAVVEGYEQ